MPIAFSFEFFPPKTDQGAEKLLAVHNALQRLEPEYFSVTYGAGGSTRESTLSTIDALHGKGAPVAPHLSCIGDSKEKIAALLQHYKNKGINRLVALRGDLPSGQVGLGELPYAIDLVKFVRETTGDYFHISVAAYPEVHPQSSSAEQDTNHAISKINAGANTAITQYFYNPDAYFYFVDKLTKQGVTVPIVPGIMPITNASNLLRFSESCGAEIPRWIRKQLADYAHDAESLKCFGHEVVLTLCQRLIEGGAPALHFYTMNQIEPTQQLIVDLGCSVQP